MIQQKYITNVYYLMLDNIFCGEILCYHGSGYENYYLLKCDVTRSGRHTYPRSTLLPYCVEHAEGKIRFLQKVSKFFHVTRRHILEQKLYSPSFVASALLHNLEASNNEFRKRLAFLRPLQLNIFDGKSCSLLSN